MADSYLRDSISNGNPREQALIRRWWHEVCGGTGEIVWEYCIQGYYADAIWFRHSSRHGHENPGTRTAERFPLDGQKIVLCEAKLKLSPELIGQALVYRSLFSRAGAIVERTVLFSEAAHPVLSSVANELGLEVVESAGRLR
jgi:hypothetical protein